jgi:hypothetical protein
LRSHLQMVREAHRRDLEEGFGRVMLPYALEVKYPSAASEFGWQWVFPSACRSIDPRSGIERRHHQDESVLQKAIRHAALAVALNKPVGPHTIRSLHTSSKAGLTFGPSRPFWDMPVWRLQDLHARAEQRDRGNEPSRHALAGGFPPLEGMRGEPARGG